MKRGIAVVFIAWLVVLAFLSGCVSTFAERARNEGCGEACARLLRNTGRTSSAAVDAVTCGCQLDDGEVKFTCRRPVDGNVCE